MARTPEGSDTAVVIDPAIFARRWWILAVLCTSLMLVIIGNTALNVAIPTLSKDLGASTSQLQWMVDAYSLVFAGLLFTGGALGDRFGRKGALQFGLLVFVLGSLLAALAEPPGPSSPAEPSWASAPLSSCRPRCRSSPTSSRPHERSRAIAIWAGISGAGAALGPSRAASSSSTSGGGRSSSSTCRSSIVALVAGWFLLPTSRDPDARQARPGRCAAVASGLGALVYAIIEAPDYGWAERRRRSWPSLSPPSLIGGSSCGRCKRAPDARPCAVQGPALLRGVGGMSSCTSPCSASSSCSRSTSSSCSATARSRPGFAGLPFAVMMVTSPQGARLVPPASAQPDHLVRHGHGRRRPALFSLVTPSTPYIVFVLADGDHGVRHGVDDVAGSPRRSCRRCRSAGPAWARP